MRWRSVLGLLTDLGAPVLFVSLAGCPSGSPEQVAPDGGVGPGTGTTPGTNACSGDEAACVHGTVTSTGFNASYLFARVYLYSVFPSGTATALGASGTSDGGNEVAGDGTFAFSQVAPGTHYFVRALARYDANDTSATVETIVGPVAIPSSGPIAMTMRPVALTVLQGRASGDAATSVTVAAARVFDPSNGQPVSDATVTFAVNGQSIPLPYGPTPTGQNGYYAALPAGTAGATSFTFTTARGGAAAKTWTVAGELPTFDGAVTSPAAGATIPLNTALNVTWQAQPAATHSVVQLFARATDAYTAVYTSPGPAAPETTTETIPAKSIAQAGDYLLNVDYAKATCPATSDGCSIATTTASTTLKAQ